MNFKAADVLAVDFPGVIATLQNIRIRRKIVKN